MLERIIEISQRGGFLRAQDGCLVLEREGESPVRVPFAEAAVVVSSHPQAVFTTGALAELAANGASLVVCGRNHEPVGMLLALDGHSTQQERFERQADSSPVLRKRLWQQVVKAKIAHQSCVLDFLGRPEPRLTRFAEEVRSGDTTNREAQAAQRYWPLLFANPAFRRRRDGPGPNVVLNYGYSVLRAIVSRAICAAGLHPALGLHHSNRYNAFCLADDLMEPYRPIIDKRVVAMVEERGMDLTVDKEAKIDLLSTLMGRFHADGESRTLFDWLSVMASSLAQVFEGKRKQLLIPEVWSAPKIRRKGPVGVPSDVAIRDVRSAG